MKLAIDFSILLVVALSSISRTSGFFAAQTHQTSRQTILQHARRATHQPMARPYRRLVDMRVSDNDENSSESLDRRLFVSHIFLGAAAASGWLIPNLALAIPNAAVDNSNNKVDKVGMTQQQQQNPLKNKKIGGLALKIRAVAGVMVSTTQYPVGLWD